MLKALVPVDGTSNCQHAVTHVLRERQRNSALEIHLLNVQRPFSRYVTRFIDSATIKAAHQEASDAALRPATQMLDAAGATYDVHSVVGEKAASIVAQAQRLRCDHIVVSTRRKNSLVRAVEGSVTNQLLELTTVPVVAIAGSAASKIERYGIPAGISAVLAWLFLAAEA